MTTSYYDPKGWLQTYTGVQFWPLDPKPEDINLADIAHALALQCRFGGHSIGFYSVAEHSVRVSQELPDDLKRWGLLHDASEAYLTDIPKPLKISMPDYNRFEDVVLQAVAKRFGLDWPMPDRVHFMDAVMLATEQRDIMAPPPVPWNKMPDPLPSKIVPWNWRDAEDRFLMWAKSLGIE